MFPKTGRRVFKSIAMPIKVLISDTASAPASSTAFAIATMSVTFGESFTMTGKFVCAFTVRVTSAAVSGCVPKAMLPLLTFGQEILISSAAMRESVSASATSPYSSTVFPTTFAMSGTS